MNRLIVKFALAVAMALFVSFTAVTFIFHQSYITSMGRRIKSARSQ